MQNNAVAAGAHWVAEADRTSVHIEPLAVERSERLLQSQHLAAIFLILPSGKARQNLGGESLVDLPQFDVLKGKPAPLHERSEERRVGKEGVSRWGARSDKKKTCDSKGG